MLIGRIEGRVTAVVALSILVLISVSLAFVRLL